MTNDRDRSPWDGVRLKTKSFEITIGATVMLAILSGIGAWLKHLGLL